MGTCGIFPAPGKPVFPLNLEEKDRDKKRVGLDQIALWPLAYR